MPNSLKYKRSDGSDAICGPSILTHMRVRACARAREAFNVHDASNPSDLYLRIEKRKILQRFRKVDHSDGSVQIASAMRPRCVRPAMEARR